MVLTCRVVEAAHLLAKDRTGKADAYVKLQVVPADFLDSKTKKKTAVLKKSSCPVFNENFTWTLRKDIDLAVGTGERGGVWLYIRTNWSLRTEFLSSTMSLPLFVSVAMVLFFVTCCFLAICFVFFVFLSIILFFLSLVRALDLNLVVNYVVYLYNAFFVYVLLMMSWSLQQYRLTIGVWDHQGGLTRNYFVGGMSFSLTEILDEDEITEGWFVLMDEERSLCQSFRSM